MLSHISHVQPCVTLWNVTRQSRLSMGFSRRDYWSGLPCPPAGDLPDPGVEHSFPRKNMPVLKAYSGTCEIHLLGLATSISAHLTVIQRANADPMLSEQYVDSGF